MRTKIPDEIATLRKILGDDGLRKQISQLRDEKKIIDVVMKAGDKVGFHFEEDWLREAFDDVRLARTPAALSENELLSLAVVEDPDGGTSSNKLCHTVSCGGNHKGCC